MKSTVRSLCQYAVQIARAQIAPVITRQIVSRTGLSPIEKTSPQDVFICGYPKSGNTWFQYIISALVFGAGTESATDTLVNDLVPDIHVKQFYRRYGDVAFFKTHELPRAEYRRIVYLLRDGRDAMVSYYHYLSALNGAVDFHEMVRSGRGTTGKWHSHVLAYQKNPFRAEMIVVRYEDLKSDTTAQLRRLCDFLHLERSDEDLARVAEATSFGRMRAKEQSSGWSTPCWPRDRFFVRRGVVGSFKDEMPPEVLSTFLQEARETLVASGYSV